MRDANGEKMKETVQLERPRVFFATVFNGEQIDGLPPQQIKPKAEQQWDAVERAEHILNALRATITHAAGDRAFYRPSTDSITLPEKSQFESADRYYATALHELGHWTGHSSRLDRDLTHPFGSEGYAKEELRAEISSIIMGEELNIGHDPGQHAAYVKSWIKVLEDDPLEIFRASSDAEKIHKYLLAFEQVQEQEKELAMQPTNIDTNSTDAGAEMTAMLNDQDLQNRMAEHKREYINVPFKEKDEAKAAGALWGKAAKSWYVGLRADMAKLERWNPDNVLVQGPTMKPREEFAQAMRSASLFTGRNAQGDHPIMDGKRHRVPVEGGKKSAFDGFYVGHLDGHPAGRIINNKTGTDITWKSKGYALSDEEKAKLQAAAAEKLAQRAVEQDKAQEATAQRVGRQMADLVPIEQPTPYLQAKDIQAHAGVMTDREGQKTYIPAFDAEGKQWTMQYIQENGTKRFAKNSKKEGCFHAVGGMDALTAAPALVISEGYATAAQVAEAVGHATVAAFDSGNLEAVAKALHVKFPHKPVIIVGDDDRHLAMTHGHNPGREKAEAAAQAVGGKAIFPIFAPAENIYPRDLPAITPNSFKTHLRAEQRLADAAAGKTELAGDEAAKLKASMLSSAQIAALSTMKQHTDFNDLAHKSELGIEGVKRQIGAAISQVQREEQQHQKQKHQKQKHQKQKHVKKNQQQIEQRPRRAARIG